MSHSTVMSNKRRLAGSASAALLFIATTAPAYAAIDNTATASGTYKGNTTTSPTSSVAIPVVPKAPGLTIVKSASAPTVNLGARSTIADAGDTITYTYTITNTGNVRLTNVSPNDAGPTFNGKAGTGTMSSFVLVSSGGTTLDPGQSLTYNATYTMSALDVLRAADVANAVSNTATAKGTDLQGTQTTSAGSTATATIPAGPLLSMTKTAVLTDSGVPDGKAAAGEIITYTYTITNIGNVALTGVTVSDTHEGALLPAASFKGETLVSDGPLASETVPVISSDTTANNGVWSTLQPGAVIKITYTHTVTQAEVDGQ